MSEGKKHDQDKLRFDLILPEFEQAMAEVLTHGAKKYGDNNWKLVEGAKARYTGALQRHLNQYRKGYMYDLDSDCNNLAQIAVNAMFLYWFEWQLPLAPVTKNEILVECAVLKESMMKTEAELKQEVENADKILSASIDHRVLAAATGTKQDPPCGSSVDTASESQFDPRRYK